MMLRRLGVIASLGSAAALLGGCAGGQSASPALPRAGSASGSAKIHLSIKVPVRKAGSAGATRRGAQYVSAATTEIGIRTGVSSPAGLGGDPWQMFDVAALPAGSSCTPATGGFRTCALTVTAPVPTTAGGADEFQIVASDSATAGSDTIPSGNYLSVGDDVQSITPGQVNDVVVTLNGLIATIAASNPVYTVWAAPGSVGSVPAILTTYDADHDLIADLQPQAFGNPLTFCDSLGGASSPAACPPGNSTSPFTYSANLTTTPTGPIPAQIGYAAPLTGSSVSTTVTVGAPSSWGANATPATFTIATLVVSTGGTPTASIPNLSVSGNPPGSATDVIVTLDEVGASSFTLTNTNAAFSLLSGIGGNPIAAPLPATNGAATFDVHAVSPTTGPASFTVTDAAGTVATISVVVVP